MGIRAPRRCMPPRRATPRGIGPLDGRRGFEALAQFQGALAHRRADGDACKPSTAARAQTLVEQLDRAADDRGRPLRRRQWHGGCTTRSSSRLPPAPDDHGGGSAGGDVGRTVGRRRVARVVTWEGQPYRLDLGGAERRRLQRVRERQEGVPLDVALTLAADGRALAAEKLSARRCPGADRAAERHARRDLRGAVGHEATTCCRPASRRRANARDALRKAIDELTRDGAQQGREASRARRRAARRARRHADRRRRCCRSPMPPTSAIPRARCCSPTTSRSATTSGFGGKDGEVRLRVAWAVPRAGCQPRRAVARHRLAARPRRRRSAPLALRRLNFERVLEAPKLTSNERDAFAVSVALLNPFDLRDDDRDAIADAIARGRRARRRARQRATPPGSTRSPTSSRSTAAAARACAGPLTHEPRSRRVDVLADRAARARRRRLGRSARLGHVDGGRRGLRLLALDAAGPLADAVGRPQLGLTAVGDGRPQSARRDDAAGSCGCRRRSRKSCSSGAMQDFIDEVRPTDDADWLTLVARGASRDPRADRRLRRRSDRRRPAGAGHWHARQ